MKVSVIIPAYNEEKNIAVTLKDVFTYLKEKFGRDWELIMVDDGSKDATCAVAGDYMNSVPEYRDNLILLKNEVNKGKGSAVRKGMLAAKGDMRLFMDADNATKIIEFDKFVPEFKKGFDIIIGSRKLRESRIVEKQPFIRRLASLVYHRMVNILLGTRVSDYNCGFKALKGNAAAEIFQMAMADGWEFDAEMLFLAKKKGYKLAEVPVMWEHKDTSKVRTVRATISSLNGMLSIKKNDWKGKYTR